MKIVTWNMNFWYIYSKGTKKFANWKKDCIDILHNFNADFLLLQEINPCLLFDKEYNRMETTIHSFELEKVNVYYHELLNELMNEGCTIDDKFWGNCIISSKKNKFLDNNITLDNYYYGKCGLMAYNFLSEEGNKITVINIYNKKNNRLKKYTMLDEIQSDIKETVEKNSESLIILAGDFNGNETDEEPFFEFLKNDCNLVNCTENFETTVNFTKYQNDYIFTNKKDSKIKSKVHRTINFSDHYPVEIDII